MPPYGKGMWYISNSKDYSRKKNNNQGPGKMKTDHPHCTSLTVRGYELDSYGHVNNAVYLQYLEQARWMVMRDANFLEQIDAEKLFLVVIDTHIRYLREAILFDELVV